MRVLLDLIRYVLAVILGLSILFIYSSNIVLSTILSEGYALSKLQENNYEKSLYDDYKESVSKYIMQSGLDESVIENICSIDKIEEDIKIIVKNIYNGSNNQIEIDSIKTKLKDNIDLYLDGKELSSESQKSIDDFVNIIGDEYTKTIFHNNYEKAINRRLNIINGIVLKIKKYGTWLLIGILILIFIINIKNLFRNVSIIGIGICFCGGILVYGKYLLLKTIDINNLYILNNGLSNSVKNVLQENIKAINKDAILFCLCGLILIIIGNLFQYGFKKDEK